MGSNQLAFPGPKGRMEQILGRIRVLDGIGAITRSKNILRILVPSKKAARVVRAHIKHRYKDEVKLEGTDLIVGTLRIVIVQEPEIGGVTPDA